MSFRSLIQQIKIQQSLSPILPPACSFYAPAHPISHFLIFVFNAGDIEKLRQQIADQELRRTQMEEICDKIRNLELVKNNLEEEFTQYKMKLEEQKSKLEADTKEDQIRVIFTNVDEVDKNRQFTFDTKIVDSKYIISNCNPPVRPLDTFIKDLNESNNFAKFVINVRKAFKKEITEENCQNIPQNGIQ
eukprot:Seg3750.2 transcript_id=Seg3750.2/GoldUCD/mRNA.D3Y31 product="Kinetochore protein spc25" protein_id=Seg3750.2/GoldUCD/D3Y31